MPTLVRVQAAVAAALTVGALTACGTAAKFTACNKRRREAPKARLRHRPSSVKRVLWRQPHRRRHIRSSLHHQSGMTWAQHVAERLGQSTEPNEHTVSYSDVYQGKPGLSGPGGLNYAEGGARANSPYSTVSQNPEGTPISTAVQLQHFVDQQAPSARTSCVPLHRNE